MSLRNQGEFYFDSEQAAAPMTDREWLALQSIAAHRNDDIIAGNVDGGPVRVYDPWGKLVREIQRLRAMKEAQHDQDSL